MINSILITTSFVHVLNLYYSSNASLSIKVTVSCTAVYRQKGLLILCILLVLLVPLLSVSAATAENRSVTCRFVLNSLSIQRDNPMRKTGNLNVDVCVSKRRQF